mmetsp:Transcript_29906/g.55913  ORF Transcript_29906/g.55913 Transcript_29906/m.55913 type:complete len:269 (-) Transcript_29906:170-976(-)
MEAKTGGWKRERPASASVRIDRKSELPSLSRNQPMKEEKMSSSLAAEVAATICDSKPSRNMQVFVHIFKFYKLLVDNKTYREYKDLIDEVYSKTMIKVLVSVIRTRDPMLFVALRVLRLFACHDDFYQHASAFRISAALLEVFPHAETKSVIAEAVSLLRVLSEGPKSYRHELVGPTGGLAVALMQLLRFPLAATTPRVTEELLDTILNLTGSRVFCEVLRMKGFLAQVRESGACNLENMKSIASIARYAGFSKAETQKTIAECKVKR